MAVTTSIYQTALTTLALIKSYLGGDEKLNSEPVHDAERDINADEWNLIAAALSEVAKRTRPGNIVRIPFYIANATASLTDQQLQVFGPDADRDSVAAWLDGSIVGLVAHCENDLTAGTADLTVSIGGTGGTLTVQLDDTNQIARARQLPGAETFSSLDELGVQLTTSGTFAAGTTPSIWGDLIISMGEEEAV